jgi:predicted RNA-binding protein associated with RNAse of E/G family
LSFQRIKDYLKAKKQLQSAFNKGNLTKEQYDRFVAEVDRLIEIIKKQGGII